MKALKLIVVSLSLCMSVAVSTPSNAQANALVRAQNENTVAFAQRVLKLTGDDDTHVTQATWNARNYLFVDYVRTADGEAVRDLVALEEVGDHHYRKIYVTTGEEEGGTPDVEAIGFADERNGAGRKLIVLLAWNQQHYDVTGTLYEVRIFEGAAPSQSKLTYLSKVSHHFDVHSCDCDWRGGKSQRYPYRTIAAIKAELSRIGF